MTKAPEKRLPWDKFSWDAWENEPGLALCSMAAQGFWMRLLCICAKEGGYLLVSGKAPSDDELAYLMRQPVERVREWLKELEDRGVFSRDRRKVIYSRRMVRDTKNRAVAQQNGKRGGNPNLRKDTTSGERVNLEKEKEREEDKEKDNPHTPSEGAGEIEAAWERDEHFGAAWDALTPEMRRRSKSRAKTWPEWKKAARAVGGGGELAARLRRYIANDPDARRGYGPAFDRWLRDGKWENWTGAQSARSATESEEARVRRELEALL